jgi:hypothetical protein
VSVSVAVKKCNARGSMDNSSNTELERQPGDNAEGAPQINVQTTTTNVEPRDAEATVEATTVEPTDTPSVIPENICTDLDIDAPPQGALDRSADLRADVAVEAVAAIKPEIDPLKPASIAVLVEFAEFVLARVVREGERIVLSLTATEDVREFNRLANRIRLVLRQQD